MLSIILYGRNDSHGYNLHKRAALSLNCLAEVLADEDDEIIFVDYNTPVDLPTFIEAIRDTLTGRALAKIRVLRVEPAIHDRLYGGKTHLMAIEPISRNIGVRRSNPRNRWILSTNTDMVFVPRRARSLTEIIAALPDGFYELPRFDVPAGLWEQLDRRDPVVAMETMRRWGTELHLNEIVTQHDELRYDAPGDFQLALREQLFEISGFNEAMIFGWHVDSNLCRRMYLRNGRTRSLVDQLFGYHCDHMRVATLAHRADRVENDFETFFLHVDSPNLAEQSDSWGLPNVNVPEVDLARGPASRFAGSLAEILEPLDAPFREISAMAAWEELTYHSEHLVPYIGDQLVILPETVGMTYVGGNGRMASLLSNLVDRLGFRLPLRALRLEKLLEDREAGWPSDLLLVDFDTMMAESRLLIFDFGFDAETYPFYVGLRLGDWPAAPRHALGSVLNAMEKAVVEDLDNGHSSNSQYRKYVTLNSIGNVFEPMVADLLIAVPTPFGGRVRHGFIDRSYESPFKRVKKTLVGYLSFQLAYRMDQHCKYEIGEIIDFTETGNSYCFAADGWSWCEATGTWTDGSRATIRLTLAQPPQGDLIAHWRIDRVANRNQTLTVEIIGAGRVLDVWRLPTGLPAHDRITLVPRDVVDQNRLLLLELRIQKPVSPEHVKDGSRCADPRKLGVHLAALRLEPASFLEKVAKRLGFRR